MPTLSLSGPVSVARTGSTLAWAFTAGALPGQTGDYTPGDKSEYLKLQLVPSAPFSSIPVQILVTLVCDIQPHSGTELIEIDDVCRLGTVGAPTGTNKAGNGAVAGNRIYGFDIAADGFTLADLNAGNIYVWFACKSILDSAPSGSVAIVPTGNTVWETGSLAWSGSPPWGFGGAQAHVTSSGSAAITVTSSDPQVVVSVTASETGFASQIPAQVGTAHLVQTNSYGGSYSSGVQSVPIAPHTQSTTQSNPVTMLAGSGTVSVSLSSASALDSGVSAPISATCTVTASIVTPDPSQAIISQASVSIPGIWPPPPDTFGGRLGGYFLDLEEDEMTTRLIDDVVTIYMSCTDPATGAAANATGSPAYRVYEESMGTPLLTGTLARLDSANTTGQYVAQFTASAANGFEIGKTYQVLGLATVVGVAQEGPLEKFIIRAVPATSAQVPTAAANASAVWTTPVPAATPGRATTMIGVLAQVWRYLYNRNKVDKTAGIQTCYGDDETTPIVSGLVRVTDTSSDKRQMS